MATRGNSIFVTSNPRGVFMEGTIKTGETPKPGTVMQFDISAGLDGNNKFTWEIFNTGTDGTRPAGPLIILVEDRKQGKLMTDAYTAGDRCYGYVPIGGEEFNMLYLDIAGTTDDHTAGEIAIVNNTDGKLIVTTGSPEIEPFMLLNTVTDPEADFLAHVIYTGY